MNKVIFSISGISGNQQAVVVGNNEALEIVIIALKESFSCDLISL